MSGKSNRIDRSSESRLVVGADIGQVHDPTALAVVESVAEQRQVRHLERLLLGTPYPQVVGRIANVVLALPGAELVVDATGVGRPVVDQLHAAGVEPIAVTITAGRETTFRDGMFYVPKRELIGSIGTALENEQLQIASSLRYARALVGELQIFRRQVTGAGRALYGAETGAHDDLVIAAALAVWRSEQE